MKIVLKDNRVVIAYGTNQDITIEEHYPHCDEVKIVPDDIIIEPNEIQDGTIEEEDWSQSTPENIVMKTVPNMIPNPDAGKWSYNNSDTESVRTRVLTDYDLVTDKLLLNTHNYIGIGIRLTAKDQRNYSELLRMSQDDLLSYPLTTRDGVELNSKEEVAMFVNSCSAFIMTTLTNGYGVKASIGGMTKEELLDFNDEREVL